MYNVQHSAATEQQKKTSPDSSVGLTKTAAAAAASKFTCIDFSTEIFPILKFMSAPDEHTLTYNTICIKVPTTMITTRTFEHWKCYVIS